MINFPEATDNTKHCHQEPACCPWLLPFALHPSSSRMISLFKSFSLASKVKVRCPSVLFLQLLDGLRLLQSFLLAVVHGGGILPALIYSNIPRVDTQVVAVKWMKEWANEYVSGCSCTLSFPCTLSQQRNPHPHHHCPLWWARFCHT